MAKDRKSSAKQVKLEESSPVGGIPVYPIPSSGEVRSLETRVSALERGEARAINWLLILLSIFVAIGLAAFAYLIFRAETKFIQLDRAINERQTDVSR